MAFKNSYLAELAKKLKKWRHKIMYSHEIKTLAKKIMWAEYTDKKAYKLVYYLKNKGYLLSIKKEIFYVKFPEDHISEDLILEDRYRYILHHHAKSSTENNRYIWWLKALELWLNNFAIPDDIQIVNTHKQSKEIVVAGKSMQFKKYSSKKENFFKQFKKHTNKVKMGKYSFPYAWFELALLECLYNFDEIHQRYTYEVIRKVIRKSTNLDLDRLAKILKIWKHHTSINRLYKIAKKENKTLAAKLLPIIKKRSFVLDV
jgi:hypothetical protein